MGQNRRRISGLKWESVTIRDFYLSLLVFITLVFVFSGNPFRKAIFWGVLGSLVSVALALVLRFLTVRRQAYWMLAVPTYVAVLVGVPALGAAVLSDWFVAVGNNSGFFTILPPAFEMYLGFIVSFPTLA